MGRRRKGPWVREQDQCWYTTVGRKSVKLGHAGQPYSEIEQAYHALLAKSKKPATVTVAWLIGAFLDDVQRTGSTGTFLWYSRFLNKCRDHFGNSLKPENLTGVMVSRWIERDYGDGSGSTQHGAARAIVRVMNWAVEAGHLDRSPLIGYKKPTPTSRETYVSPDEYAACLEHARGQFRDFLIFLWETGCRPQEARIIEADWIEGRTVTLPTALSKGKRRRRVIYLTETAAEIAERLSSKNPSGPIFRNKLGNPWTKDAINCAFRRLRKKTGIDSLCAYAMRHGFATEKLKQGTDTTTVGVLMGHANPGMVAKVYQHLAHDSDYLLGVIDSGTPPTVAS
ncbi:MAG: site-specific integrase [Planctomycetota bacterium]